MNRYNRIFIISLFAILSVKVIFAQPIKGKKFEFSTSASMWHIKEKNREPETVINLPFRFGYYIFKGLEIEPELFYSIHDGEESGYLILANLAYNFKISEKDVVFILGGGGFGNSPQYFTVVHDYNMDITAFNFGVGIKHLVSNSAAIRIEYRYTKYTGEFHSLIDMTYYELDRTDSNIYMGISIFFWIYQATLLNKKSLYQLESSYSKKIKLSGSQIR